MDHFSAMNIFQCFSYLENVVFSLKFGNSFPSFEQIVQCLRSADFKEDVNKKLILKKVLKVDDVMVAH